MGWSIQLVLSDSEKYAYRHRGTEIDRHTMMIVNTLAGLAEFHT